MRCHHRTWHINSRLHISKSSPIHSVIAYKSSANELGSQAGRQAAQEYQLTARHWLPTSLRPDAENEGIKASTSCSPKFKLNFSRFSGDWCVYTYSQQAPVRWHIVPRTFLRGLHSCVHIWLIHSKKVPLSGWSPMSLGTYQKDQAPSPAFAVVAGVEEKFEPVHLTGRWCFCNNMNLVGELVKVVYWSSKSNGKNIWVRSSNRGELFLMWQSEERIKHAIEIISKYVSTRVWLNLIA